MADRVGMVHAGSSVVRGTGEAVVVATGSASAIGRVAALVQEEESPATPLQRRLDRLGRQISVGVVVACLVFLVSGLLRGQPWEITAVAAVALAVAAVPDSLPAVVTLALAGGASRMSTPGRRRPVAAGGGDPGVGDPARHGQDRHADPWRHGRRPVVDPGTGTGGWTRPSPPPRGSCWRPRHCATTPTRPGRGRPGPRARPTWRPRSCGRRARPASTSRRCARPTPGSGRSPSTPSPAA